MNPPVLKTSGTSHRIERLRSISSVAFLFVSPSGNAKANSPCLMSFPLNVSDAVKVVLVSRVADSAT